MTTRTGLTLLLFLFAAMTSRVWAGPPESVPEPLRPWVPWVLHDVDDHGCPPRYDRAEEKRCVWANRLELQLGAGGGTFRQGVKAYRKSWFALPGEAKRWPQSVTLDGLPAVVVSRGEQPGVWLPTGEHQLMGAFIWSELPDKLTLPRETALIALSLKGRNVASPFVDESGLLWLAQRSASGPSAAPVGLRVFRLLEDGVPLTLTTHLSLEASTGTEAVLGPVLPPGAVVLALQSPLPTRIEADGSVRVQLRPGQWEITLVARLPGPVTELTRIAAKAGWPEEEVWSFAAAPTLRVVTPGGADSIDPQQADMPREWKRHPAFRMRAGDKLQLTEVRRGDPLPEPDRLNLVRHLWLDFDGAGYTAQDQVRGALSRHWRLEMAQPYALGRAALDASDQLITRLSADAPAGIELRRGNLDLTADSRVEGAARTLPVTGWRQDFQSVSARLSLPPGWRLVAVSGVDRAQGAWLAQWTLLDFFLVLVATLAVRQLWGMPWAAVALAMLALSWHEPGAPRWAWLALLSMAALTRAVPEGRLQALARWARRASWLALLLIGLPYAVGQIRQAIYPVLELPHEQIEAQDAPSMMTAAPAAAPMPAPEAMVDRAESSRVRRPSTNKERRPEEKSAGPLSSMNSRNDYSNDGALELKKKSKFNLYENDPRAVVQTGPGLPRWNWHSYELQWSGPVEQTQTMTLWLTSPAVNALLDLARVALAVLVALCIAGVKLPKFRWPTRGMGAAVMLMSVLALLPTQDARADSPVLPQAEKAVKVDADLLAELKARLSAPNDCHPACAEISRMAVDAGGGTLTLRLAVGSVIDSAIPLPGRLGQWQPRQVLLDGRPGKLSRDEQGTAWMLVNAGAHQIVLEGALDEIQTVGLPMKPRLVSVQARGYRVEGVDAASVPADALRISALSPRAGGGARPRGQVPSFVRIERSFALGLRWELMTRVVRVSSDSAPVTIDLPLLDGETVISEGVRAAKGRVQAVLPAQAADMEWRSTLAQRDALVLTAAKQTAWVEVWRFDNGALWHVDFEGLAPVHHQSDGRWQPEWRPWPGETLKARISRPEGVAGRALTIDGVALDVRPGLRATDSRLTLTLRSSRGGEHAITLPEGAELLGAKINGESQPLRLQERSLRIPVPPGEQRVELNWREPRGIGLLFPSSELKLNAPSVNASVQVHMPSGRWLLGLAGPSLGPAILFWGVLLALIPIALALARVPRSPLGARDWFLLGLGLTQSHVAVSLVIVTWFFALALRKQCAQALNPRTHNLLQVALAVLTTVALGLLLLAVRHGLLGSPQMQVAGNGSSAAMLHWYQDRAVDAMPGALVLSAPLLVYRLAMLAWALWLALRLIGWSQWGWRCFAAGGYWRRIALVKEA